MQKFANEAQFLQWAQEFKRANEPAQAAWQQEIAIDMGVYEGGGWYQRKPWSSNEIERLKTDLNIDSAEFRSTYNVTTPLVQRKAATTHPTALSIRATPPERNLGPTGTVSAQLDEDLANVVIDAGRLVSAWQEASFQRWVIGCYGIGISLRPAQRTLSTESGDYSAATLTQRAFAFLPLKLIMDPAMQERDLGEHDEVMYEDVWSIHKATRILGDQLKVRKIDLSAAKLRTMGDLNSFEVRLNALSQGRLFPQFRSHSQTKGLKVTQVHRKDDRGRFSVMEIMVEVEPGKPILLNPEDNKSPYGGDGLPLRLLHGHRRGDTMYSLGATRMLKDGQDRMNRTQTCHDRQMIKASRYTWTADRKGYGNSSDKEIAKRFTTAVGGVHIFESGTRENPVERPMLVNVPPADPQLREMMAGYYDDMRKAVHSSPGSFGETLSHVPNSSFQRALDEGGAVDDQLVNEDKLTCESIVGIMVGTAKKLVRDQDPGMLGLLDMHGFTGDEMRRLADADPTYPGCGITISDGSIRVRSWNAKKQDLESALEKQAIDPKTYRREMAGSLDSPLVEDDKLFDLAFDKIAAQVLEGSTEFAPLPLDNDRAADLLHALQRALVSREANADPATRQRVAEAIQSQRMLMASMAADMAAAVGGPGVGQGATNNQAAETPEQGNFSALVDSLSAQSQAA